MVTFRGETDVPDTLAGRQKLADKRSSHIFWENDDSTAMRIWDRVEQQPTSFLPTDRIHDYYLKKVVFLCTACEYTDIREGGVASHIKQTISRCQEHERADFRLVEHIEGGTKQQCTACGYSYRQEKPRQREVHLSRFSRSVANAHEGAGSILRPRFALGPPSESGNGHITQFPVPASAQEDQSPRQPTRRHRRGRRGGRSRRGN